MYQTSCLQAVQNICKNEVDKGEIAMENLCFNTERIIKTDVLVCGGGVAGCAAALAAARHGAKVILIENAGTLGGQAGIGIVTPLDAVKARNGKSFGGMIKEFCDDIANAGEKYCFNDDPQKRHFSLGSPHITKYILLKKLVEAGVQVRFHTTLVSADTDEKNVTSAVVLDKTGFCVIKAESFIDATGDADLIAFSGAEFSLGSEKGVLDSLTKNDMDKRHFSDEKYSGYSSDGVMQPVSIFFIMGGVNIDEARKLNNKKLKFGDLGITRERFENWKFAGSCGFEITDERIPMPQGRVLISRGPREDMAVINMSRVTGINGADADSLNEGEIKAQLQLIAIVDFLQTFIPGFEKSYLIQSANTLGVRETRRLNGRYKLSGYEAILCEPKSDAVARGSYCIDIHDPNGKSAAVGGNIKGDFYDIPYGCLLAKEFDNLLACGRCISVDHVTHASTRIQGTCIMTGQAAGTACAMALKKGIKPANLNVEELKTQLIADGVYLD